MKTFRIAFVIETGLGHRTMYELFRRAVNDEPEIDATWLPIEFTRRDLLSWIPGIRSDFVVRGGVLGWTQLIAAMRSSRFDAVFYHTQMVAVFCHRLMRNVPSFVSIDATPSQFASMGAYYGLPDPQRTSLRERVRERWYKDVFTSARCVIGMSEWSTHAVRAEYGVAAESTRVCYPGVDLQLWSPKQKSNDGPIRLLFVGGQFTRKGGDLLLRWMADGGSDRCTLDIVTGDPVPELSGVRIHRLGPNDPRLIGLFQNADLFVLPTRADAASLVSVEAMACATPVLTTRVGGIPEWVGSVDEGATVIEPDDYELFSQNMDILTSDRTRLRDMGRRARMRAERMFDGLRNVRAELTLVRQLSQPT